VAELNVNPTRMELRKTKAKLKTANKGHKLLKDKTNELIRNFYTVVRKAKEARMNVERKLKVIFDLYSQAKTRLSDSEIELLFMMPTHAVDLDFGISTIMNTEVPKIEIKENVLSQNLPYSPLSSTSTLDKAVAEFYEVFPEIVHVAELEKSAYLLANEIEKCKRRVNAIEHIFVPKYEETISSISLKLSEAERSNTAKLMKLKGDVIGSEDEDEKS